MTDIANTYHVTDEGWASSVLRDVRVNRPCSVALPPSEALAAIMAVKDRASLPPLPLPQSVPDPTAIIAGLAAVGAAGGLSGTLAVVMCAAHLHGMVVEVVFRIPPAGGPGAALAFTKP